MSSSLLNIGATGLRVADINLQVTGNNIANASTPGYSRQEAVQTENTPMATGAGYLGQGVNVTTVKRIYDQFLTAQVQSGQASTSAADQLNSLVSGLDSYLSDSNSGLGSALTGFFNAADSLASNPSSTSARQVFLSAASTLQTRFNAVAGQMNSLSTQVNTQVQTQVNSVNSTAQQIASLNDQIAKAEAASGGQPANDLRDQRDQLVQTLNQSIKASVVQTGDGQYNIYVGNGQALVQGNQSYQLTTVASQYDPTQLSVGYKSPAGTVTIDDSQLGGGALGGLMQFRQNTLIPAQNSLGRLAAAITADVNTQNKEGMDLNGKLGTDLFSAAGPSVAASSSNTGTGSLTATITNANAGQGYDYQVKYSGGAYTVSHYPDGSGAVTVSSWPTTIDGVTLNLTGAMNSGDSFLVRPTANAASTMQTLTTDYHAVAAASPVVVNQGSNNTGSTSVASIGVDSTYAGSPLTSAINLTYSGGSLSGFPGNVTVTVNGTSTTYSGTAPYTQGATYSFNGIQMSLTGTPASNDTFTVSANTANSTDGHNASAFAQLRNATVLDGGTTSLGSAWTNLVTQVGIQASQASANLTSQKALLASSTSQQQSVSGVNLDDEAMNLMKYQQAYQASAKVMQTANSLFDSLLSIANG
ncbi:MULTISPECIES: flagellar hook-associated protein FlgK [Ralstonia solanacearum species complex]|uniref:Flagellar hook-associated protein 1 n=1 Tax=Ralstonia syzygii TaxID=28097 RepID=A0ABX7ZL46_9RALS|nr:MULTISPECIES: flagellar hook-associated protein FlgK [Ralstonia solanacearum species complex]BEU73925.1 flagellar hook-associated protein FlgK [Ralstonia pseudosolanacearum]AMP39456.1 flagellar biosynthesis protein FlgK [Ralstonia solanacearum]AXV78842.1 flagellar hook-associated protein FlgK [Ralstonia solanacearum]AXV88291.1 flagellar hook-associated protein FlgK [Ralstonia solanacearum]AXV92864.1 flagellar hook-associated protein FlgK [Ralstonia solanacearum]